jgi:DNA-binding CsgD family transcriptional regulator
MKHTLSPRQAQIMYRICQGMLAKEISGELAIGPRTVKAHVKEAKRRLNARTLAHAAVIFSIQSPAPIATKGN